MDSSAIYENNLAALSKRFPELAKSIRMRELDQSKFKVVLSEGGKGPNLLVPSGSSFILYYEYGDPLAYCRDYLENLKMTFANITVFMGFGLGYHLLAFVRLFSNRLQTRKIIVFEENLNLFHLALRIIDLTEVLAHPHIHFFVGPDPGAALAPIRAEVLVENEAVNFMRSVKVIPVPSGVSLNPDFYRKAMYVMRRACRQMAMMTGNDPLDSLLGLDNILMNIPNIVNNPGIDLLFDRFKGRPAVSVAAGPSLNKNIHLLKEISNRALIVCCDASFLPLMNRGIRPHIVVGFERTDGTEHFYRGISDFDGIYYAICPLVRPRTFDYFKGKKIIVHRRFSHFLWLGISRGELTIGPSVGNMAYKVSEVLGCDPIILIGQDLAFAPDGNTHAKDMPFGEKDDFYHKDVLEVEGNDGSPIKTCIPWDSFRVAFEEDLRNLSGTCINATEGGAKIRGAEVMPLRAAIDRYCTQEFDPVSMIEDAISGFQGNADPQRDYSLLLDKTRLTASGIRNMIGEFKTMLARTRLLEKYSVHPFLQGNGAMDKKAAESLIVDFIGLMDRYIKDENVSDAMWHTLQAYSLWFNNRFNTLPEIYPDEECLRAAQVLMIKDWLGVVGQMYLSTLDSMEKTENLLVKELAALDGAA